MSNISIDVYKNHLELDKSVPPEIRDKLIAKFIVGVKSIFAEYIAENYDVKYVIAMEIVKIEDKETFYKILIDSPEKYVGKTSKIVSNILKYDLGSITEKISPLFILKRTAEEISSSIQILWRDFVRDRGDEISGQ